MNRMVGRGRKQVVWTAYISDDWLKRGQAKLDDERKALQEHIHPIGRLGKNSAVLKLLIDELVAMDNTKRQKFLELVTANPRLPAGGLPQAGIKVSLLAWESLAALMFGCLLRGLGSGLLSAH